MVGNPSIETIDQAHATVRIARFSPTRAVRLGSLKQKRELLRMAIFSAPVPRASNGKLETFRLWWERVLADNAEAEFIVAGRWKTGEGGASY
jgi:hypothetical protein